MSAKSSLTNEQNTELCQAVCCRGCAAWQGTPWYFSSLLYPFFPRTLLHLACRRLSHEKSVQRIASKVALVRTAQQTVHLQKNTHCDGCEVSPRQMQGGTFLPSLPCSGLNWDNLQSGAKLWKSCRKVASSCPASSEQAHNILFLPSAICEQSGRCQGQKS